MYMYVYEWFTEKDNTYIRVRFHIEHLMYILLQYSSYIYA